MSWFRDDLSALQRLDCDLHDEHPDEAVAEGVTLVRRSLLGVSAAGLGALLGGARAWAQDPAARRDAAASPAGGAGTEAGELADVGAFLREVHPRALEQVRGGDAGEATYLLSIAHALSRLAAPGSGVREALRAFRDAHAEDGERFPLAVLVMDLAPGGGFEHHDHRDYNGVLLGLAGEARVRNYDVLGDVAVPERGTTFQVRETHDDLLLPGRFSMLQRRADNVHDVVAGPEGCRVLDLFTFYTREARSHYLDVDPVPRDPERRVHDASWR